MIYSIALNLDKKCRIEPPINFEQQDNSEVCIFDECSQQINSIHPCSCVPTPNNIPTYHDDGTKDGEIEDTKQNGIGDCWLLSGVNALSYTEAGREVIKNALEYHDGYTVVHTAAGDYTVTDEELAIVREANTNHAPFLGQVYYSTGDDDMLILELAVEKVIDDVLNGNIAIKESAPWYVKKFLNSLPTERAADGSIIGLGGQLSSSSTNGGWGSFSMYLLSGKGADYASEKEDMDKYLSEFQNNGGKDIALSANILSFDGSHSKKFKDINGNKVKLGAPHAYAIKYVTDDTVTFTNPWDSSKEIVFSREQFLNIFTEIEKNDLSENNPKADYIIQPQISEEIIGNDKYEIRTLIDENGKLINKTYMSADGNAALRYYYDENGQIISANFKKRDRDGGYISKGGIPVDGAQRILEEGLLNSRFNPDDLVEIASIDKKDWDSMKQYFDIPYLEPQLSGYHLLFLSRIPEKDRQFAVDMIKKYPNLDRTHIMIYSGSDCPWITTEALRNYADGKGGSFIDEFLPDNLKESWWDIFGLKDTFRDCLKKIENNKCADTLYQRIIDRHLILNPYIQRELSGDDIYYLAFIPDSKWDEAMQYLQNNPNMSGKDIYYKLK